MDAGSYRIDQLYPSLLIATASVRPVEDEDTEAEEPIRIYSENASGPSASRSKRLPQMQGQGDGEGE